MEIAVENITGSWCSNLHECITESVRVYKFVHKHYEKYYRLNLHAEDLDAADNENPPPTPYEPKPSTSTYTYPGYDVIQTICQPRSNPTAPQVISPAESLMSAEETSRNTEEETAHL